MTSRDDWIEWGLLGLAAFVLLGGGAAVVYAQTRGLRNNNPGNIKLSSTAWQGKVPNAQNTDGTFEQFTSAPYGIRAMATILKIYQQNDGLNTVQGIISRWSSTDQDSYIANVASALGVGAYDIIDVTDPTTMTGLVNAIIHQENGINPYPVATVQQGISMAGIS